MIKGKVRAGLKWAPEIGAKEVVKKNRSRDSEIETIVRLSGGITSCSNELVVTALSVLIIKTPMNSSITHFTVSLKFFVIFFNRKQMLKKFLFLFEKFIFLRNNS